MNSSEQFDGVNVDFVAERTGWGYVLDRYGKPAPNKSTRKMITEIWPRFEGSGVVEFWVGGQDQAEDPISWSGPYTFTIGTDRKINCRESWNLLAYRIEGNLNQPLRLVDLDLEVKAAGGYW